MENCNLVECVRRISWQHVEGWKTAHPKRSLVWQPPVPGVTKIHVDVAVQSNFSMAVCVCWDHLNNLPSVDPTVGEAEALCLGMAVVVHLNWQHVLFEGDSLIVMNFVLRDDGDCH